MSHVDDTQLEGNRRAMQKLFTVIALDALENPIDRIEVYAGDIGKAHLTAVEVWKENLPEMMWIFQEGEDWYVAAFKTPAVIQ